MAAIKSIILFDRYSVPVAMNRAVVDTDIQLHEYHEADGRRVCRKTLCSGCGAELTAENIVKGYEADGDRAVLLGKEELRTLKDDAENRIDILYSTSPDQVSPVYFNTSYIAVPDAGGETVFELLRLTLSEDRIVLIGRAVTSGMDSYVAVSPAEDGLIISKLYLDSELLHPKKPYKKPPVTLGDLIPVKRLLGDMYDAFDMSACENDYQKRLRELIAAKTGETT
jgi:DNA end-binding protein Ku